MYIFGLIGLGKVCIIRLLLIECKDFVVIEVYFYRLLLCVNYNNRVFKVNIIKYILEKKVM